MQRIPTLYGFSIIVLVLVLMILNHIIYMEILDRSMQASESHQYPAPEVRQDVTEPDLEALPEENIEDSEAEVGAVEIEDEDVVEEEQTVDAPEETDPEEN